VATELKMATEPNVATELKVATEQKMATELKVATEPKLINGKFQIVSFSCLFRSIVC
jgi:hypothetical protein